MITISTMTDEPHTPTTTASDLLAAEIIAAIEAIAARIARLEGPHPSTAPRVRGARTIPDAAIISMIAAVEREPQLQALGTFDGDNARAMLQFNHAFDHVLDRLNMLTASLSFTMEAWKAEVVSELLRTYDIMKGLARDPRAGMMEHVATLRRDIGRTNPGRKVQS